MGKEHGKESGITGEDVVKSDNLKNITPGKTTHSADDIGEHFEREAACHGKDRGTEGCFLSDRARDKLIGDLRVRAVAASSQFNAAITELKIEELIKKPEDMHWAWGLLLDVASNFVIGAAIKSLTKAKAGLIRSLGDAADHGAIRGQYDVAAKAEARRLLFHGISDEVIRQQITGVGGLAKTKARGGMQSTLAGVDHE